MSLFQRVRMTLGVLGLAVAVPFLVSVQKASAQSGYVTNGLEYPPVGNLPGDQIHPAVALTASRGIVVWDDNITDPAGQGISAQILDATFSPTLGLLHLNQQTAADQENPQPAILNGGGMLVVWQGGKQSFQHIYGAFLGSNNILLNTNGDVMVSTDTNHYQAGPAVAALVNGNAVVTWASYGQDNADGFQGVYAQIMSPAGVKTNGEFPVNQFKLFNQRTPAVASFPNGNFIIVWISEKQNSTLSTDSGGNVLGGHDSVDVYARLFGAAGNALTDEFMVNTGTNICADPAVAVASDNTFTIVWGEKNTLVANNSWDIVSRQFASPTSGGPAQLVNSQLFGDQYAPKISSIGTDYLVVWTSMGQDGSREGVYAQYLRNGVHVGSEFRVNTTILNSQVHPTVASDGFARFLTVWSSYVNVANGMDLMAQRYINTNQVLSPPAAPVVSPLETYILSVTWAPLAGFNVDHWNLYVDGSTIAIPTTNTYWQNEGIEDEGNDYNPGSTHTFQLAYVLTDGRQSPLSGISTNTTWQRSAHGFDLPADWEISYYGTNWNNWKNSAYQLAPGVTVGQVFLWGANPNDPATWLVPVLTRGSQGMFLNWSTHPGYIYQVQISVNGAPLVSLGPPRFAPGSSDSIFLGPPVAGNQVVVFQIIRLAY